jgi:transposase-like protein
MASTRNEVPVQRDPEPTSLTQISAASAPTCPYCGSTRLTKIAMTLTDGSPVDFSSCHTCEQKSWLQDGEPLPIDVVLAKAQKHK